MEYIYIGKFNELAALADQGVQIEPTQLILLPPQVSQMPFIAATVGDITHDTDLSLPTHGSLGARILDSSAGQTSRSRPSISRIST